MGGRQVRVDGELLDEGEFLVEREAENEGFAFASDGELSVEIDPALDDELRLEGRVLRPGPRGRTPCARTAGSRSRTGSA